MSLTPRAAGKLMLYPRHNFQIGREAHANVGKLRLSRVVAATGVMAVFGVHVFRRRGPFVLHQACYVFF